MRGLIIATIALSVVALVAARCPSGCSQHGSCGADDKCTCWKNWQGPDCSLRTCEYGNAWATDVVNDAHAYAECSAKGLCDRVTGECVCFEGYTGAACKRSVCPNDCSSHGKCRLVNDLVAVNSVNQYREWDGDKIQACVCDGGYTGPDCSIRLCPRGDDPMTVCAAPQANLAHRQIQLITITAADDVLAQPAGLSIHFTDNTGEVWTTNAIADVFGAAPGTGAAAIKKALEAIPNFRIPTVDVAIDTDGANTRTFSVTFTDGRVSGKQNLLTFDYPLGCHVAGCHPKYRQPLLLQELVLSATSFTPTTTPILANWIMTTDSQLQLDQMPSSLADSASTGTGVNAVVTVWPAVATGGKPGHAYRVVWGGGSHTPIPKQILPSTRMVDTTADAGTGYQAVPLGYGIFVSLPAAYFTSAGIASASVANSVNNFDVMFNFRTATIETTQSQPAHVTKEDLPCSNRGQCDTTTGTCTCFEGYYGDHCGLQTILV